MTNPTDNQESDNVNSGTPPGLPNMENDPASDFAPTVVQTSLH